MAYRRRYGRRSRIKKVSVAKIKYSRPTARNQKRQILSNKSQITKLAKIVRQQRVYTDWFLTSNNIIPTSSWFIQPLTNPGDWRPALRTSLTVTDSVSTTLLSTQIYFAVYNNGPASAQCNVYLVSPAHESADRNPFVEGPIEKTEFMASNDGSQCITLNRDVFKIRHHKSFLLTTVNPGEGLPAAPVLNFPGDPRTCYKKWSTSYRTNFRLMAPTGLVDPGGQYLPQKWRSMQIEQLPYHRRVYFMIHVVTANPGGVAFYWHQHAVCVNSD